MAIDGDGEKLDRYELISEIASGGMATVFLARNVGVAGFQRLVAIKRLHPHLAKDPDFVDMFLDEARLAARIHHPNVVSIQEVGQNARGGYYLVMDYVEGATLGKLLTRAAREGRRIPADVVLRIMLDTLAGLHAAHELTGDDGRCLEIVHRDVSPQNVLLGADGVARLSDFGVARAQSKISVTKTGQLKGKLAYMAPEQARGKRVDRRADLFACGIVLWECLALRRLFKGDSDAEVLNKVLYEPIPGLREATPSVSVGLEAVVAKALAREPDDRYPTALAFAEALEDVAKTHSLLASPRDLARCLDGFFGEELTGHRESIRALLSSAPRKPKVGLPLGTDSDPNASGPQSTTAVTSVGEVKTITEPRGVVRDGTPSSGHSVAAIHLEGQRSSTPPSPRGPRLSRWVLVLALGIGFGALASLGVAAYQHRDEAAVAPSEPSGAAKVMAALPSAAPVAPSEPVASASAPQPSAPASAPVGKKGGRHTHGGVSTASSARSPSGGDDIGKNPYRQ